jgi:hypothetical protein
MGNAVDLHDLVEFVFLRMEIRRMVTLTQIYEFRILFGRGTFVIVVDEMNALRGRMYVASSSVFICGTTEWTRV